MKFNAKKIQPQLDFVTLMEINPVGLVPHSVLVWPEPR